MEDFYAEIDKFVDTYLQIAKNNIAYSRHEYYFPGLKFAVPIYKAPEAIPVEHRYHQFYIQKYTYYGDNANELINKLEDDIRIELFNIFSPTGRIFRIVYDNNRGDPYIEKAVIYKYKFGDAILCARSLIKEYFKEKKDLKLEFNCSAYAIGNDGYCSVRIQSCKID